MSYLPSRRRFLKATATVGTVLGLGDLGFLSRLPRVSAEETKLPSRAVNGNPEIEGLVKLLETTSRDRLLEEVAHRIGRGVSYREVVTALMLAGVRNIEPRPVGFKFHAVLVVNSAHLASISSPDSDRWLPIFWALDHFKQSQAQNAREGDWHMTPVNEAILPPAHKAKAAFTEAMDNWDEAAADAAITVLARTAGAQELFELFCRYGARDFRDIGHKAIYVANGWRTLQAIGWQHAEPILRSLAYALLYRDEDPNPAKADHAADRPWRHNQALVGKIRNDWLDGKPNPAATSELLQTLRVASADDAAAKVVELINRGTSVQSIWDGIFEMAGELLMRRPGLVALHAVTTTNALHFAWQNSGEDESRRLLLLQNAAFLPLFRADPQSLKKVRLDEIDAEEPKNDKAPTTEEIFAAISRDRLNAARKALTWLNANRDSAEFITAARRLVFLKGKDSHDYKFSSAVLEDYAHVSPELRNRFLAASVFNLRGSGSADNDLVKRTRAALS